MMLELKLTLLRVKRNLVLFTKHAASLCSNVGDKVIIMACQEEDINETK